MLLLTDLISLAKVELGDYKIHCATGIEPTPLEAFFDGTFRQWQEYQHQKNFKCQKILSLIHLEGSRWLFAGMYIVEGVTQETWKNSPIFKYSTQEVEGLEHLTGRVIVQFNKTFRASYLRGENFGDQLFVAEIHDTRMTIGDFPGYKSVMLSFRMFKTIVRENNASWRTALSNVAGIYLITDTKDGKLYIGSAYGGEGIWQRWIAYVKNGHGGNKELRELLRKEGEEHVNYFQFALLEICDVNASDEFVISRENYWKQVLRTREFGLNKN